MPGFLRDAKEVGMSDAERTELVVFLSVNPTMGELIGGSGGARKLRWRRPGTGKSGGYRVITYYAGADVPTFLLNIYTKGDRDNLDQAERNALRDKLARLADSYRRATR